MRPGQHLMQIRP